MRVLFVFIGLLLITTVGHAQQTVSIKREAFSLKYPASWTVDTEDEDYDPDTLFSIDSPGGDNMIMFIIFDTSLDKEDMINSQVEAFTAALIRNPEITSFDTWGNYKGSGKILRGKLMGTVPGFVKVFVYSDDEKSLLVLEQCDDKAYETLKKDYALIASSFQFKK